MAFLRSLRLRGLLSFGPESEALTLEPLNVFIGPNASGKSNLIEAINVLKAAAGDLASPIREGGGIGEYLWKGVLPPAQPSGPFERGSAPAEAEIDAEIESLPRSLRHKLRFREAGQRFELTFESVEEANVYKAGFDKPYFYYRLENGKAVLNEFPSDGQPSPRRLSSIDEFPPNQSVLSQYKDPQKFPEITRLGSAYSRIHLFRDWHFGSHTPPRRPQRVDLPDDFLLPDASNLGLILNQLEHLGQRGELMKFLGTLHPDFVDVTTRVHGGTIQVYFHEKNLRQPVPATRLSDGTIRFLCLAAVLLHPNPPPLICLEEPEIALHPDVLHDFAKLLLDASKRTQIILTTHSTELVDAFTHSPSTVVVVDKEEGSTRFRRLSEEYTKPWPDLSLGQLWQRGQFGGNRW